VEENTLLDKNSTAAPSLGPHTPATPHLQITYEALKEHHKTALQTLGKTSQELSNYGTALNAWMADKGVGPSSPVGNEMGVMFKDALDEHLINLEHQSYSPSTINSRKSLLTNTHKAYLGLLTANSLPEEFHLALLVLVEASGLLHKDFAKRVGVSRSGFGQWLRGEATPSTRHRPTIERIEAFCGLQAGTLAARVQWGTRVPPPAGVSITAHQGRQKQAVRERYRLNKFTDELESEWHRLFHYMTTDDVDDPAYELRNSVWTQNSHTGRYPTADKHKSHLCGFYGFLCLPDSKEVEPRLRGKGFRPDELSLAFVSDAALVKRYVEFLKVRAGAYNNHAIHTLAFSVSLIRAGTGFLRLNPEFGLKLPKPVPAERWDEWCEEQHQKFKQTRRLLKREKKIKLTRNPEDPIEWILDREHPMDVLVDLADAMEAALPPVTAPTWRTSHYRDMFLVRFLTVNPLRVGNFAMMTYKPDNTGNLRQDEHGAWWLVFSPGDFKNRKYLGADENYRVKLPPSLAPYIETYLREYRPQLAGYGVSNNLFLKSPARCRGNDTPEMSEPCLADAVFEATKKFVPNCGGFRPQAFRHIVATEYIKNSEEGYEVAAKILNDRPETVRKAYSHVKIKDHFAFWVRYYESRLKAAA
jgi:transcriptional regulator with XRE-family HTH domain